MTKFIAGGTHAGGPHNTSGLPGFPARDWMGHGGSLVLSPIRGVVSTSRPFGKLEHQDPRNGFYGARLYLERPNGKEIYMAHFGLGSHDIRVRPGTKVVPGTPLGYVGHWPGDPGRSHIHVGDQAGDPLHTIVDADGDILMNNKPPKALLILRKVGHRGCRACQNKEGRWQVRRESKPPKVLYQGSYQDAERYLRQHK
jgi:hypothetical protein